METSDSEHARSPGELLLSAAIAKVEQQKQLADRAIAQVSNADLHRALDAETNSIAVIMKHVAGNLISRWTDFLSTDGEKPDRNRDGEFVDDHARRAAILEHWERGWGVMLATLHSLTPDDLTRTVHIRTQPLSVSAAILRSIEHNGYHIGQIVMLARHWAGPNWQTLTIPRGGSSAYNDRVRGG